MNKPPGKHTVGGRVTNRAGQPQPGVVVRAFLRGTDAPEHPVAAPATTDAEGRYLIELSAGVPRSPERARAEALVRAFADMVSQPHGESLGESEAKPFEGGHLELDVVVERVPDPDPGPDPGNGPPRRVYGVVRDEVGQPVDDAIVRAFDRDLRTEQPLGDDRTKKRGHYEIKYKSSDFARAEKGSADLVVTVDGRDGETLHRTPIHFNVPDEFELNVDLRGEPYPGPSEWEQLNDDFSPLLEGLQPQELREDEQHQDISFLAGESSRERLAIAMWIACFHLSAKCAREETPLAPEVFYAFLRQGQPSIYYDSFEQDMQHSDRLALFEDKVLRALAELDVQLQVSVLAQALAENLVPIALEQQVDEILETLAQIKLKYAGETTLGGGKGTVGDLVEVAPIEPEERTAFLAAFAEHTGPLGEFWQRLGEEKIIDPERVPQVRITFELGALTRNHVPLVRELADRFAQGELTTKRELAKLSREDWKQVLARPGPDGKPIGVPDGIDGETEEERYETYALILDSQFERSYPTASFAAKFRREAPSGLRREAVPDAPESEIVEFLEHNATFQLDRYRIEHYIDEHEDALQGIEDPETLVSDLKSVQRAFKLKPTYQAVDALLTRGIDSAQQIYFMGEGQFLRSVTASGEEAAETPTLNRVEARQMYRRAENTYALALTMYGDYSLSVNGPAPFAVPSALLDEEAQEKIAALPTLQALFGSLDYCECSHCRSVYSPAAYFVDVMRFLDQRATNGTGIHAAKSVHDVLLGRRPDLGEIELSCENTNTPVPYIDLVNEILEDVVTPPPAVELDLSILADLAEGPIATTVYDELVANGIAIASDAYVHGADIRGQWVVRDGEHAYRIFDDAGTLRLLPSRQTFLSAQEVRANPEYTNQAAYTTLRGEVFPLTLPFDLWHLEARTYLEHLGVPHPRLLELFQQTPPGGGAPTPTELQIDCAWLGITETERQILTGTLPGRQPWEFWGLDETANDIPNPNAPSDPTQNITGTWIDLLRHVDVLMHRARLTYRELLQVLDTRFVDPGGTLMIDDAGTGSTTECDTSTFSVQGLNATALDRVHRFVRLRHELGWPMWEIDLLIPDLDPGAAVDKQITDDALQELSLVGRLADRTRLDRRVVRALFRGIDNEVYVDHGRENAPTVQTLYQRLFRNRLVDAAASFPPSPEDLSGPIEDRVPGLLAALRIGEADLDLILEELGLTPADDLDAATLDAVFRIAVFARAVDLSVDAFLRLVRLWGEDPFASPAAADRFADLVELVTGSDFTVFELDYLLAHGTPPTAGIALEDGEVIELLEALRDGLQTITDELRLQPEETAEDYVQARLGQLPRLASDADQQTALAIIGDTFQGTAAEREALIDELFADVLDLTEAKAELAAIPANTPPDDRPALIAARFAYVQPELEEYLRLTQRDAFVRTQAAEALDIDAPTAAALLDGLTVPGGTDTLMAAIADPRLLQRLPDGSYELDLDEATFPDIFTSLRLLHKVALVVDRLELRAADVVWWIEPGNAAEMGWIEPGDLPVDSTTSVPLAAWEAMQRFFAGVRRLPPSELEPLEFASRVLDATRPSSANLDDLADLTGWLRTDIDALVAAFGWLGGGVDDVKDQFRVATSLEQLADAIQALRRLGVNPARAIQWASPEPSSDDAETLRQTVKAKYDLTQWQQVIQPISDELREHKRAALVDWLVAHPDAAQGQSWTDSDGLYSYFLIDVEMSACMLTSRLKQAAGSAQLFVQRCLMNLELDTVADSNLDPKWKQWAWMKRYRVWEANRKVFLYPENWIEPELRDEKSPFFLDLEDELMQNDVTTETAEEAYLNYLEKLDAVANLEVRAMYDQVISQDESVLHVFGRGRSTQASEYWYRRRINRARWTPWERVDLEIDARNLIAGVHNRRLYLLWPQLLEGAEQPTHVSTPESNQSMAIPAPRRYWEVRLFRSELKKGKWLPESLSDSLAIVPESAAGGMFQENVTLRTRLAPYVQARLFATSDPLARAPRSRTQFDKIGRQISVRTPPIEHLISPADSRYVHDLIRHDSTTLYFSYGTLEESGKAHDIAPHANAESIRLLGNISPSQTFSAIDSRAAVLPSSGQFFVWDQNRSYFIDYIWRVDWSYISRVWRATRVSSFRFFPHYHPFTELFTKELNIWGLKGLLNRRIQIAPETIPGAPAPFDFATYQPDAGNVVGPFPVENVDFDYLGPYAPYNWELFFHAPLFIASKLAANQRFEEALEWFHYIFDPTNPDQNVADPDTPQQRFWITKPFYETTKADYYAQKIEQIMLAIAQGDIQVREQVKEWRDKPFNPHLIARMRTVAYQKAVLIKYIQTLIAWGDQLFRQDTIESINEATQLYILAASVLGERPRSIPRNRPEPVKTLYQLEQAGIDDFGNVLKEVENLVPTAPATGTMGEESPELPHLNVLYFCIPHNERLLTLWDTVEDRLFKVRHCMNIEGVTRSLALFEPPIDPGALVAAAAAGVDIGSILSDMSAPMPLYRFTSQMERALAMCQEVKSLGSAILAALEKRDAEAFALLRSAHEQVMLDHVRRVRERQVEEAVRNREALEEAKKLVEERRRYYAQLLDDGLSAGEIVSLALTGGSIAAEIVATVLNGISGGTAAIPAFTVGAAGFGGSPVVTVTTGGYQVADGLGKAAEVSTGIGSVLQIGAGMAATIAGHERRLQDWEFQRTLAELELPRADKEIATAIVRERIAEQERVNQDKQIELAEKEEDHLRSKFTNQQLYDWMINQLSGVYFRSYQLAYDLAKRAERCFRYELGLSESSYVQFGSWDSLRKGLLSGERLLHDLKRLESAYYERNRREYELTKQISLAQLDPAALLKLRQNGECFVELPEMAFDMDYPGHYFRRLKSVGMSIPCTTGPNTTVACTITLTSNRLRKDSTLLGGDYARDLTIADPRFRDEIAGIQSIATSGAQDDRGMFQLDFRDERYLPFEGAGAISSWQIKLNPDLPQFDYSTIADVIMHVDYTAREGGGVLRGAVVEEIETYVNEQALADSRRGLYHVIDLRRELADKWHRFLYPPSAADDQELVLEDLPSRLPYFTRGFVEKKAWQIEVLAKVSGGGPYKVQLSPLGTTPADEMTLAADPTYQGLQRAVEDLTGNEVDLDTWTLKVREDGAPDFKSLDPDAIEELFLVIAYTIGT